jgi:hypothetical protein
MDIRSDAPNVFRQFEKLSVSGIEHVRNADRFYVGAGNLLRYAGIEGIPRDRSVIPHLRKKPEIQVHYLGGNGELAQDGG